VNRKEVLINGKVFKLGLKGLEDAVRTGSRTMELQVGPVVFLVGTRLSEGSVLLHWTGETNINNVIWIRFVELLPRWPLVKKVSCFTFKEEI